MQPGKISWLLVLTLALAPVGPGIARGEATPRPQATKQQDQAASPQVQIIRRVKVVTVDTQSQGSGPTAGGETRAAGQTVKTGAGVKQKVGTPGGVPEGK